MSKARNTTRTTQNSPNALVVIRPGLELPAEVMPVLEASRSLQEVDEQDTLVPWLFFNMLRKGPDDTWLPKNVLFHSLREDTREAVECTLLFLHKTHRYSIFEEGSGTKVLCSSLDRVHGLWRETGEQLQCEGCQYAPIPAHWKNGIPPPCRLIWTFVAFDEQYQEPFAINVKSTSMTPAKRFLNTHFIGKFKGKDLPLFVYKTRLVLTQPTGTYAVLGFEIMGMNAPDEITHYAALAEALIGSARINFEAEQPEEVDNTVPF